MTNHSDQAQPLCIRTTFNAVNQSFLDLPPDEDLRAVQLLQGHAKFESTVRYPRTAVVDALEMAEQTEIRSAVHAQQQKSPVC